jgi:crotonobetainyl-CoA:carnitine CoA-transferase CaiB-like acyl-CoA transferase
MLAVGNDRQFASFCEIAGRPELASDDRYRTNAGRVANRALLIPEIDRHCRQKSTNDWLSALRAAGVPCGPINDLAQVFEEPQVLHRKMRFDLPHPLGGTVPQIRTPVFYSRTVLEYRQPPPLLGENTSEVLSRELGLSQGELETLRADGVIG